MSCAFQDTDRAIRISNFLIVNAGWNIFVLVVTLYVLLISEIRILAIPAEYDDYFYGIDWVAFCLFFGEWLVKAIATKRYILTFECYLELAAAIFVIPMFFFLNGSKTLAVVARTTMALRLLFRVVRLSTMSVKAVQRLKSTRDSDEARHTRSLIEATLVRRTNMKLLLAILALLAVSTYVDSEYWAPERSEEVAFYALARMYPTLHNHTHLWTRAWQSFRDGIKERHWSQHSRQFLWGDPRDEGNTITLVRLSIGGVVWWDAPPSNPLRTSVPSEVIVHTCAKSNGACSCDDCEAVVNVRAMVRASAVLNLLVNLIAVSIVIFWNLTFELDYRRYILVPVKRMMAMLRHMVENPRSAVDAMKSASAADKSVAKTQRATEIKLIERVMVKFGELLQMAFGEAGVHTITRNLSTGTFEPLTPGARVNAIFGFCDIRCFTECCEQLNEGTMRFTNSIAAIVHGEVIGSGGSVNKNIGDAFLAVWKVQEVADPADNSRRNSTVTHHLDGNRSSIASEVLEAFLRTRARLAGHSGIQDVARMPKLQEKFPGFRVRMGYGVHLGSAIEGPIGSRLKVDVSYLGPNVNVTMRLEELTKTYGCWLLMTQHFHQHLSPELQAWCRPVDRIMLHTDKLELVTLYTYDLERAQANDAAFMAKWRTMFGMYEEGRWLAARDRMAEDKVAEQDKGTLLRSMQQRQFRPPDDWVRVLE